MDFSLIEKLAASMRSNGIRRLVTSGIEIELDNTVRPMVEVTPVEPQGVFVDSAGAMCSCGHSWVTEHTEAGCLLGCSHTLCGSTGGPPDV